jgi:hypothetical protein
MGCQAEQLEAGRSWLPLDLGLTPPEQGTQLNRLSKHITGHMRHLSLILHVFQLGQRYGGVETHCGWRIHIVA